MSDHEDDDGTVFVRKHKANLRRAGSFKRIQSLPVQVDDWFHNDVELHHSWEEFANANRARSSAFLPDSTSSITSCDHDAKQVHVEFCDLFESSLDRFLAKAGYSSEEFQEAFRIAKDEEERTGDHFFRWPEVVEFATFLHLMQRGAAGLIGEIRKQSDTARSQFRQRATIFPMIVAWAPSNFEEVERAVEAASQSLKPRLSKVEQRERLRWKAKLSEKKLNAEGVYDVPPRDEAEWARYLALVTKNLDEAELDEFCRLVTNAYQRDPAWTNSSNSSERTLRKRLLSAFEALDDHHRGSLSLEDVFALMYKCFAAEKWVRKLEVRWRHKCRQKSLDQTRSQTESEPSDETFRLSFEDSVQLLQEISGATVDGGTVDLDKLDTLEVAARDR